MPELCQEVLGFAEGFVASFPFWVQTPGPLQPPSSEGSSHPSSSHPGAEAGAGAEPQVGAVQEGEGTWGYSRHVHVRRFPSSACAEGSVWVRNAPKMSSRASTNCQAGLGSSTQERMNQILNGKIKPREALKTTQLHRAPLCRPREPQREGTRRDFQPNWDFSPSSPPTPYRLAASLSEREVLPRLPRSRMSGWQEKSHLFSIWILTSIHRAFLLPALPRSQPPVLACTPGRPR